ncbi:galactosylgalactosylxylosylprotein 3-beta-glucuronosyltransferase S-like [Tigriopus californicus]|nr:galactosylgalactosylxylosylprotein 3-beta-glucuronosyltransferase S-like [Tigriopus californicus]
MNQNQPVLYIVTPTFARREQFPELTRLSQTLFHVPHMIWLLIEDTSECSPILSSLLERCQIPYVHMVAPMPAQFLVTAKKPRGVSQRNAALQWILTHPELPEGVLYFADDDNTFDLRLFKDIRKTQKVSMFPIGLMGETGINSPVVRNGQVVGFISDWFGKRKFPVDMGEFAVNIRYLTYNPAKVAMPFMVGYEEDGFLRGIVKKWSDIEPLAEGCTKVWVWHTTAEESLLPVINSRGGDSNLRDLLSELESTGVVGTTVTGPGIPVCPMDSDCI